MAAGPIPAGRYPKLAAAIEGGAYLATARKAQMERSSPPSRVISPGNGVSSPWRGEEGSRMVRQGATPASHVTWSFF